MAPEGGSVRRESGRGGVGHGPRALVALALARAAIGVAASPAAADLQPYANNDAGGFRNVLPPGAAGVDNAMQLAQFQATGQRPPHWADQQPLYDGLLYA